jgi:hypothetical protein
MTLKKTIAMTKIIIPWVFTIFIPKKWIILTWLKKRLLNFWTKIEKSGYSVTLARLPCLATLTWVSDETMGSEAWWSHICLFVFLFVCNRGDIIHHWTRMNYGALLHSSMSTTDNTIQDHGGLQTRKFGQAPLLFLTFRQVLSSHPRQQMVWLCRLQDKDIIHIQYTINQSYLISSFLAACSRNSYFFSPVSWVFFWVFLVCFLRVNDWS